MTENEARWIETLRAIAGNTDPAICYDDVQALQATLKRRQDPQGT